MGRTLVIGSGFGGAIAAARLAEAGFAVTLAERGPWRDSLPVRSMGIADRTPLPTGRHLFTKALRSIRTARRTITVNRRALLEFTVTDKLNIIAASGVGGGSHAYGGLNMRPPDPGFWAAAGIPDAEMEQHYHSVEARMGTARPGPGLMRNATGRLLAGSPLFDADDAANALPMGMLFPADPNNPQIVEQDGIQRWEARVSRDGTFGSSGGGKTSLDFAYLHPAMRDHGLQVLDLTEARLIRRRGKAYCVTLCDLRSGSIREEVVDHVFVAAGTLNTLELLFRSREAPDGLIGMERLGRNFFANGDLAFSCKLPKGKQTLPSIPVDGAIRCRAGAEPLGNRPWPFVIINTMPLADMPLPAFLRNRMQCSLVLAGMGKDRPGMVYYRNGRLVIDYDPAQSPIYGDIRRAAECIARELGGTLTGGEKPTTAHALGGAGIGRDPSQGVVDLYGEVVGNPGLFITDASIFPAPLGGPPSISIGAWAEHVAGQFIARKAGTSGQGKDGT